MQQKMNWNAYSARECMHEFSECCGDGDSCVYFWEINNTHEVFYVGSGKYYRFQNITPTARSEEFLKIINNYKCSPKIVFYGLNTEQARYYEARLTEEFWKLGFPLVNKDNVPGIRNVRTVCFNGEEHTYSVWEKDPRVSVSGATIRNRIEKLGWTIKDALFTPSVANLKATPQERRRIYASFGKKEAI